MHRHVIERRGAPGKLGFGRSGASQWRPHYRADRSAARLGAVVAAAEGGIETVKMITRKPPQGLLGAPYLVANAIDIGGLTEPKRIFGGTAREAAHGFPANVNVAGALALAGIGPDRTIVEIRADPGVTRNIHRIELEAAAARLSMQIENVPSEENRRTGRLTALRSLPR
jgi:aspartate dehydrogenase